MNANDLLDTVLERYETCFSYTDVGEATSALGILQFKTFFCRPNRFRFEWTNSFAGKTLIGLIYSNSDAKTTVFDGRNYEDVGELGLAVAGATGVSHGVAPLAAHLLMPELFKGRSFQSFASMKPYQIVQEDSGKAEIRANWRSDCWTVLHVDKPSMAIRQVEECYASNLEEKDRVIKSMSDLPGFDIAQLKPLLDYEGVAKTMIFFNDVKFDEQISPDLFERI